MKAAAETNERPRNIQSQTKAIPVLTPRWQPLGEKEKMISGNEEEEEKTQRTAAGRKPADLFYTKTL